MPQHGRPCLVGPAPFDGSEDGVVFGEGMVVAVRAFVRSVEPSPDHHQADPVQDAMHCLQQYVARCLGDGFVEPAVQMLVTAPAAGHRHRLTQTAQFAQVRGRCVQRRQRGGFGFERETADIASIGPVDSESAEITASIPALPAPFGSRAR